MRIKLWSETLELKDDVVNLGEVERIRKKILKKQMEEC